MNDGLFAVSNDISFNYSVKSRKERERVKGGFSQFIYMIQLLELVDLITSPIILTFVFILTLV